MKNILFLLIVVSASAAYSQSKSYDYAYTNKKGICVYSVADKKEYLIVKDGADPCISPDGKKLTYTVNGKDSQRFIKIMDLDNKVITTLNTQNDNCYGAVWSPDGKLIVYNADIDNKWTIEVIGSDNAEPKALSGKINDSYSPEWLANSKNIVVQDMAKLFVLDMSGNIITAYNLKDMQGGLPELKDGVGSSSGDQFIITDDNAKIIFSSETDEPGENGPPSAIFIYDISSKKTVRLSPKGYDAGYISIKGDRVLFTGTKHASPNTNIYSVDMDGGNFKLLFPGCMYISAKN